MSSTAKGLTNKYVENLSRKILKENSFLGVYPCDIHPSIKRIKFSLIFNTGDSSSSGEHFVAIFADKNSLYYFDSFGSNLQNENIKKFINKNIKNRKLKNNKNIIQHSQSNFCGYFCVGFLISKYKNVKFYNLFHKCNLLKNDDVIVNFITQMINKNL